MRASQRDYSVLIVEPDNSSFESIKSCLHELGGYFYIERAKSAAYAAEKGEVRKHDLVLIGTQANIDCLDSLLQENTLLLSQGGDNERIRKAINMGADYADHPQKFKEGFKHRVKKAIESSRDPLTGLLNKGAFIEKVEEAFYRTRELYASDSAPGFMKKHRKEGDKTDMGLAVLLIDFDNFKPINDEYGHAAGDRVLQKIGEFLLIDKKTRRIEAEQARIRQTDLAARLGGDEFAIMLEGYLQESSMGAAHRISRMLTEHDYSGLIGVHEPFSLELSTGVAQYVLGTKVEPQTHLDLLEMADKAMYEAKRARKKDRQNERYTIRHK